jgi:adenylate kinase family enzyme
MNLGNKIVIVGPNGSGKTTFGRKLSQITGIPHYELDSLFWKPDWHESTNGEFRSKVDVVTSLDKWIIDGNYARNQDLTISRTNTVIWLDYPLYKITFRVLKRSIKRAITGEPLWHNNRESFRKMFSRDSIVLFAITSYKRKNSRYRVMINDKSTGIKWIRIRNSGEYKEFLKKLNSKSEV